MLPTDRFAARGFRPSRCGYIALQAGLFLLGLIRRPYETVSHGREPLSPAANRFALLNHNRSIAIYRNPDLVALSLGKVIERFTRRERRNLDRNLLDDPAQEAALDATALFQTADELYSQHRYLIRPGSTAGHLSFHSPKSPK